VGRDLGNSLGKYIETEKRSWLLEQAKFMRSRVDLPLNKPLRKGGNIVNLDGSKTWVTFKFKRLPCFCFQCKLLGHDEWHCASFPYNPDSPRQYGVWLKASGNLKEFFERSRTSSSQRQDDDRLGKSGYSSSEKSAPVITSSADLESDQRVNLKFQNSRQDKQDIASEKWGNTEGSSTKVEKKNLEKSNGVGSTDSVAHLSNPPCDQHYENDSDKGLSEAYSLVGFLNPSANEDHEITSPLKANMETTNPSMKPDTLVSPKKGTQPREKANWKRNALEKGKQAQTTPTRAQVKLSGTKRPSWLDFSEEIERTPPFKKKLCVT